jgi:hypothetical protein
VLYAQLFALISKKQNKTNKQKTSPPEGVLMLILG